MSILRFCPHIQVSIFRFYRTFYFTKILTVRESFTRINCLNNDLTFTICNTYVGCETISNSPGNRGFDNK